MAVGHVRDLIHGQDVSPDVDLCVLSTKPDAYCVSCVGVASEPFSKGRRDGLVVFGIPYGLFGYEHNPIPWVLCSMRSRRVREGSVLAEVGVCLDVVETVLAIVDVDAYNLCRLESIAVTLGKPCLLIDVKVSTADGEPVTYEVVDDVIADHLNR